jgi:transglutaminase-like putative cysteine protease
MKQTAIPYSATVSVAVASVMSGLQFGVLAIPAGVMYFFLARYCLNLMDGKTKEEDPYKKGAEQIAMFGMMIFVPLIFILGITAALLVFVVFAQLALNLQTFGKRQYYLGLMLSFTLITFSASQSRDGSFILYFIPYSLLLCAALFSLSVGHFTVRLSLWLKSSALLLACTVVVYLIMPRFPALLLGATPGSEHFYHDKVWLGKAKNNEQDDSMDEPSDYQSVAQNMADDIAAQNPENNELQQALQQLKQPLSELESKDNNERIVEGEEHEGDANEYFDEPSNQRESNDDFGLDNRARQNPNIVMYVRSDAPLYLTTKIFDQFDGIAWAQSQSLKSYVKERKGEFIILPVDDATIAVGYEVELAEDLLSAIPMAWQPSSLAFPATVLTQDEYGSFQVPQTLKQGTAYRAAMISNWHQGRLVYPVTEDNLYSYLQLPKQMDANITALAQQVTQNSESLWDKAYQLEQHLRNNYAYTLDTVISSQGKTPLSEFLFETRYGHCEYFASAMALMLRTLGIPSRVVNGYAATDQNPLTGFIEVRGTDGHAWTEAYHQGLGWVPYEPTSYYQLPQQQTEQALTYEKVNEYVDRQLEILEQQQADWSMSKVMLQLWQSIVLTVSVVALAIKWIALELGLYIIAFGISLVIIWMLYQQLKPTWHEYRLKKKVAAYKKQGTLQDYEFYIQAIQTSLRLQNKAFEFSTAADFIVLLRELGLPNLKTEDVDVFLAQFNKSAYSHDARVNQAQVNWLATIFEQLWLVEKPSIS